MVMTIRAQDHRLYIIEKGQKPKGDWSQCAELGQQITFDANVLEALANDGCQPVHYDLLLLCAAVEFADRRWKRPQTWTRTLHITVPVIKLEIWQFPAVRNSLERVLKHLTSDSWHFNFVQAKNLKPCEWRQMRLDFDEYKSFAMAYSEGLDSRAVTALAGENDAVCIRVARNRHEPKAGDSFFTQIPFAVKNRDSKESSFRSRGFQFAALAAIIAHIRKLNRIVVPESGQGALGPAILPLHRTYADYRNHPAFFRNMERFIKETLGHQVEFEQPRLWFTKGQTLSDFLQLPGKTADHLLNTRSCWQTRYVVNVDGMRKQCGLCAACLLRRFSLHTANVKEPPDTYVIRNLKTSDLNEAMSAISEKRDRDNMIEYGSVGTRHFQHLADMATLPDDDLYVYVLEIAEATGQPMDESLKNLRTLLVAHAREWESFLTAQGKRSFLLKWLNGGR